MGALLGVASVLGLVAGFGDDTTTTTTEVDSGAAAAFVIVYLLFIFAIVIIQIAGMWKAFEKAGEPGWAAIIPIYNLWIVIKIAGKEGWWILLFLIPCVNIIAAIVVYMAFAEKYGKEQVYGLGLAFLGVIFWPMLGFGSSQYTGGAPAGGGYPPQAPPPGAPPQGPPPGGAPPQSF